MKNQSEDGLADLGRRIREVLVTLAGHEALTLADALAAGDLLIEARRQVPRKWGAWIDENCPHLRPSTARLYMRLAEHRAEVENAGSIQAARRLIAEPKKTPSATKKTINKPTSPVARTSLIELWRFVSDKERQVFLEQIGLPGLITALSNSMLSDLQARFFGGAASSNALSEKEKRKLKSIGKKVSPQRLREIPPEGNA